MTGLVVRSALLLAEAQAATRIGLVGRMYDGDNVRLSDLTQAPPPPDAGTNPPDKH